MRQKNTHKLPLKSFLCAMALLMIAAPAFSASLFYDSFESGDLLHAENGYQWNGVNSGPGDVSPTVTSTIAHSGTHSVKFTFGGGNILDDAWSELRYILGRNMSEVYMQWYIYYPDGTEGLGPKWQHRQASPDNNKFYRLWADDYQNFTVKTGVSTWSNATQNDVYITEYGTTLTGGIGPFGKSKDYAGATDARLGKWLKIQMHAKCASAANNDGVFQMWVDDVMVLNDTTLNLYPSGGVGNYFRNGYLLGWMNSGFDLTSAVYIDDVTISDTYITSAPLPPAPTLTLSASPAAVAYNASSTLTWSSSNATTCAASGAWSGLKAPSGAATLPALTTTAAYTLTCTGAGGSASQSATITVAPPI